MTRNVTTIGFDADDTLWYTEQFFRLTQARFTELLTDFGDVEHLEKQLLEAERRNLGHYGYGVKAFVLSMIETAIEVTDAKVSAKAISELIDAGREMLACPIDLLPHARSAVEAAAATHRVVLITKGDLLDQERKLAQSGLGDLFQAVEIVSDKTPAIYRTIFARHGQGAARGLMVGDSMRSDVVAMTDAGGWGVYVPHGLVWEVERAEPPRASARFRQISDLSGLAALMSEIG